MISALEFAGPFRRPWAEGAWPLLAVAMLYPPAAVERAMRSKARRGDDPEPPGPGMEA